MQQHREHPFISETTVRMALESLLYTSKTPVTGPLEELLLVELILADPDFPQIEHNRGFAVQQLLAQFITSELNEIRSRLGLAPLGLQDSLAQAQRIIEKDTEQQNHELTCWNLLFYRYLRADLGFSFEYLSALTHVEPRTLRRYLHHAIKRLTQKLTHAEWEARRKNRRIKLYAALPFSEPLQLFGREDDFHRCDGIMAGSPPQHIQIGGAPGIGKTSFVQEMVRQQIDQETLDYVVWIKQPLSVRYALHCVKEQVLQQNTSISLREYALYKTIAVVIDGTENLDEQDWQDFLSQMSNCIVYLISHNRLLRFPNLKHIDLRELDLEAVKQFLAANLSADIDPEYVTEKWYSQVGGNPLALRLIAHNLNFYETTLRDGHLLDQIFGQVYAKLPNHLKQIWYMLSILPERPFTLAEVGQLWAVNPRQFTEFLNTGLIEIDQNGSCRLPIAAKRYIRHLSEYKKELRQVISQLVSDIDLADVTTLLGETISHTLLEDWPEVNRHTKKHWLHILLQSDHWRGHAAECIHILENFLSRADDVDLYLQLGRCYRYIGEQSEAQTVFENSIAHCGQAGLFVQQGRALVELGVLMRRQGNYEQALAIFGRVEKKFLYKDKELASQLQLELAQIALDRKHMDEFVKHTEGLPPSPRLLSLQSTASLLTGDLEQSLYILDYLQRNFPAQRVLIGQINAALGRAYEQRQAWGLAYQHFTRAISILEQKDDLYALARAQANLGAILIRMAQAEEAIQQLESAAEKQKLVKDRVALAITQHNLRIARQQYSVDQQNKSDRI